MQLNYILYTSRLHEALGYRALQDLLDVSKRNNDAANVTGILHVEDRLVLQYLEGPPKELAETIARIRRDDRHGEFSIVDQDSLKRRCFGEWAMVAVESATMTLDDVAGTPCQKVEDVTALHPRDLIAFLSASAAFLRSNMRLA